jgi:hypothetical protein
LVFFRALVQIEGSDLSGLKLEGSRSILLGFDVDLVWIRGIDFDDLQSWMTPMWQQAHSRIRSY